jgi:hypothetical protein
LSQLTDLVQALSFFLICVGPALVCEALGRRLSLKISPVCGLRPARSARLAADPRERPTGPYTDPQINSLYKFSVCGSVFGPVAQASLSAP